MAKCKLCKTNIPDGTEYCKDCQDKEKAKANESYLDGLLNSVKNTAPATESIYKKKNDSMDTVEEIHVTPSATDDQDDDMFQFDIGDIEEFDQFDIKEDLTDLKDDVIISDKELFGEDLSDIPEDENVIDISKADKTVQQSTIKEPDPSIKLSPNKASLADEQKPTENVKDNGTRDTATEPSTDNINSNDMDYSDDGLDADLNDLLNQLDAGNASDISDTEEKDADISVKPEMEKSENISFETEPLKTDTAPDTSDDTSDDMKQEDEDDFLTLLNQISSDDPVAEDVKVINDLIKGGSTSSSKQAALPSDVGEVFSDALKAVSSLNDPNLDEEALLDQIPDKKNKKEKKKKEEKKKNKATTKKQTDKEAEEKPKEGLLKRLFGNVEDKSTTKKRAASSSDDETLLLPDKKAKPKKGKKGKAAEEEEPDTGKRGKAKAEDNEEAEDSKGKKKKKKEKKEKKNKTDDAIQVIDDIDEDVGRINRLGATIVFVFFGLLAILIYVGSNAITYTLNIQHATSYFDKQKYTQAYDQVYEMKIDDEDVEIYSKIMTVMFVNKQLNSYNNYCSLREYPQALDSLLKGLKRYDKYIELATYFGIEDDMDYVREQLLAELKSKFNLSEEEAVNINKIDNMKDYSLKVYDIALQKE